MCNNTVFSWRLIKKYRLFTHSFHLYRSSRAYKIRKAFSWDYNEKRTGNTVLFSLYLKYYLQAPISCLSGIKSALHIITEINFYKIVTQHICRERSHPHPSDYIANDKNN